MINVDKETIKSIQDFVNTTSDSIEQINRCMDSFCSSMCDAVQLIGERLKGKNMDVNILHSTDVENVVDNPQHYKHGTFEVIDEMIMVFGPARTYDFCIMNAWKYRSRAPYKDNMEQDMDKADRYLQMAYQIMENNPEIGHVGLIKED